MPLLVGALNPQMLRLAGALADGVVLNMVPEQALRQVLTEVRRGAEEAGRDPASLEVVARLHVCVAPSIDQGRDVVRMAFGPYVAVGGYNRFFQWIGMEPEALAVKEAFAKGDRIGVAKAMTPRLCDAIGITGDEDSRAGSHSRLCRARRRRLRAQSAGSGRCPTEGGLPAIGGRTEWHRVCRDGVLRATR